MVERTVIWNDNHHTDNYELFFNEVDENIPEMITLTTRDDDKNNPPNKWEFDIVDKVYIDTADQKLQDQIDDINTEIENDYCKVSTTIGDYGTYPATTGIYNLETIISINQQDGNNFGLKFKGQIVIDDLSNINFMLYQYDKHDSIAMSVIHGGHDFQGELVINLFMNRDYFNNVYLSVYSTVLDYTKVNIGVGEQSVTQYLDISEVFTENLTPFPSGLSFGRDPKAIVTRDGNMVTVQLFFEFTAVKGTELSGAYTLGYLTTPYKMKTGNVTGVTSGNYLLGTGTCIETTGYGAWNSLGVLPRLSYIGGINVIVIFEQNGMTSLISAEGTWQMSIQFTYLLDV